MKTLKLICFFFIILCSTNVSAQNPNIPVQMTVNGQTETAFVKKGDKLMVTWTSQGAVGCGIASSYNDFQINGKEMNQQQFSSNGTVVVDVMDFGQTAVAFSVFCWPEGYSGINGYDTIQLVHTNISNVGTGKAPVITKLSPAQGPVGTTVTVAGRHFTDAVEVSFVGSMRPVSGASPDTVSPIDGDLNIKNISQKNGKFTFTVPSKFESIGEDGQFHTQNIIPGTYYIVVHNADGNKSGVGYFRVTKPGENVKVPVIKTTYIINQNLELRNMGPEVIKLQKLLAKDKTIYPEGSITGYYGKATEKAVQRFQCKYQSICSNDNPVYGKVDMNTRYAFEEIYGKKKSKNE